MALLDDATLQRFGQEHGLRFITLFGSRARGLEQPDSDVDLALMPEDWTCAPAQSFEIIRALIRQAHRGDIDVVWLPHASWLLASEVARDGVVLYEAVPGRFDLFRVEAALRYADSDIWRRRDREFTQRFLEGRWDVNVEMVRRKMSMLSQYLREMEQALAFPEERFVEDPFVHHTAERLIEIVVECAAAINTEVAQAVAGIPPSDYYSSFFSLARAGWIPSDIATALGDSASLRNVLVHQYEDIRLPRFYQVLQEAKPHWRRYVQSVQEHLDALTA